MRTQTDKYIHRHILIHTCTQSHKEWDIHTYTYTQRNHRLTHTNTPQRHTETHIYTQPHTATHRHSQTYTETDMHTHTHRHTLTQTDAYT